MTNDLSNQIPALIGQPRGHAYADNSIGFTDYIGRVLWELDEIELPAEGEPVGETDEFTPILVL